MNGPAISISPQSPLAEDTNGRACEKRPRPLPVPFRSSIGGCRPGRFSGHGQNIARATPRRAIRSRIVPAPFRPRLRLDGIGLSSPSEDLDMAENEKHRSWQLLFREAVRDADTSRLVELIHELKKMLREREHPSRPKPQLVRAQLEPELREFRYDHARFRRIFDQLHEFAGLLALDGRLTLANRS